MIPFGRFALILVFALPTVTTGKIALAADPVAGRSLARKVCAYCHVVEANQAIAPTIRPKGPDFSAIAANPSVNAERLRSILMTTHKTKETGMPNPLLSNNQIENVVSFILSLH